MRVVVSFLMIVIMVAVPNSYAQKHIIKNLEKAAIHDIKPTIAKTAKHVADTGLCFPVEKDHVYSLYSYIIDLRKEKMRTTYAALFAKYNYEFTGYVWEGILQDIIRNCPDKEIAQNTFVKAQDNMVFFTITRYKAVPRFPSVICPILCDTKILERYIKNADRNHINNF